MPTTFPPPKDGPLTAYLAPDTPPDTRVIPWKEILHLLRFGVPVVTGGPPPPPTTGGPPPSGGRTAPSSAPPTLLSFDPANGIAKDIRAAIEQKGSLSKPEGRPNRFTVEGSSAPVIAYDLAWARLTLPDGSATSDADLLRGLNLWLRFQRSVTTATSTPPTPPPRKVGGNLVPYGEERCTGENRFEYWANSLYNEIAGDGAKIIAGYLLQGRGQANDAEAHAVADPVNPGLKVLYRWLPATDAERNARAAERTALQADPTGPHRWLDDDEAAYALDFMRHEALWIMAEAVDAERASLLASVGAGTSLPGGVQATDLLAYHATTRTPQTFRDGGITCPTIAWKAPAEIGADQVWHPLRAGGGYAGQALFRRASADNELATTVSIAQSAVTALDFPLVQSVLEEHQGYRDALRAGTTLPDDDYGKFRYRGGRPVTSTWCYLLAVKDVYNTSAIQTLARGSEKFVSPSSEEWLMKHYKGHGELATTKVGPEAHLVGVRYERVHYGTSREAGMRYQLAEIVTVNPELWPALVGPDRYQGGARLPFLHRLFTDELAHFPMCGVKRGESMSDDLYRQALHDAYETYVGHPGPKDPLTVPDGLVAELDRALAVAPKDAARSLLDAMLVAVVTAWKHAIADLTTAAKKAGAL
ncbi:hypothetical protein LO762_08275 [Actinocorallia sp. API 0066]|uniref:hypothetical protein n=1 Tax=Actinocorallia sp. API 0066 TaxID=2896846 RepID=UPI001E44B9B3|nr:hypothetical protein [Actinocorallia sp. API 0066]MCD0449182.1 hypothetical protein [Actinocorallia sp. API 0066]